MAVILAGHVTFVTRVTDETSYLLHRHWDLASTTEQVEAMKKFLTKFQTEEQGATAVEYALLVSLIAIVIIGAVTAFGLDLESIFTDITTQI